MITILQFICFHDYSNNYRPLLRTVIFLMVLTSTLNIPYLTLWLVCIHVVMVMLLFVVNQFMSALRGLILLVIYGMMRLITRSFIIVSVDCLKYRMAGNVVMINCGVLKQNCTIRYKFWQEKVLVNLKSIC